MDLKVLATPEEAEVKLPHLEMRPWLNEEDTALRDAYRAVKTGRKVVSLREVVEYGGVSSFGAGMVWLPRIGVARPGVKRCAVVYTRGGTVIYRFGVTHRPIVFRRLSLATRTTTQVGSSAIPSVPVEHRPASMRGHLVLWEAAWETRLSRDPALLKPLGHGLYEVVAEWDLTQLEATVIGEMRR